MRLILLVIAVVCFLVATILAFAGGNLVTGPIGWDSAGLLAFALAGLPFPSFTIRSGA